MIVVAAHRQGKTAVEAHAALNKQIAIESARIGLVEQAQGFFKLVQAEDRARHDRELEQIRELLNKIYDKLDSKADKDGD